jgi:import inner membrane translocase subunit TIM54
LLVTLRYSPNKYSIMSDKPSTPAAENAAGASSGAPKIDAGSSGASAAAPQKPIPKQNPAFKAMGKAF